MDNKFDAILHVLQKRNIWMKNKKECRSTDTSVLCRTLLFGDGTLTQLLPNSTFCKNAIFG